MLARMCIYTQTYKQLTSTVAMSNKPCVRSVIGLPGFSSNSAPPALFRPISTAQNPSLAHEKPAWDPVNGCGKL